MSPKDLKFAMCAEPQRMHRSEGAVRPEKRNLKLHRHFAISKCNLTHREQINNLIGSFVAGALLFSLININLVLTLEDDIKDRAQQTPVAHQIQTQTQPSQSFLVATERQITLVNGLGPSRSPEEEDGFIMQARNETSEIPKADSEERYHQQDSTMTTEVDSQSLETTTTTTESTPQTDLPFNDQNIAIDANRRRFLTHDQLSLLNASTKDQTIYQSSDQNALHGVQSSRAGMSKASHVSSLLSDIFAYATKNLSLEDESNLHLPAQSQDSQAQSNRNVTASSQISPTQAPEQQVTSAHLGACPGVCHSIITASILCRNEIDAACPSFLQRCCDKDDVLFDGTPVETSAPMYLATADNSSATTTNSLPQGQEQSSLDTQAAVHQATIAPPANRSQSESVGRVGLSESENSGRMANSGSVFLSSSSDSDDSVAQPSGDQPTLRSTQPAAESVNTPVVEANSASEPQSQPSSDNSDEQDTDSRRRSECEGYCTIPLFAMLCDSTYESADCPSNKKCCIIKKPTSSLGSTENVQDTIESTTNKDPQRQAPVCRGTCLPIYHSSLCTKPNEPQLNMPGCLTNFVCCATPLGTSPEDIQATDITSSDSSDRPASEGQTLSDNSVLAALVPPPPPSLLNNPTSDLQATQYTQSDQLIADQVRQRQSVSSGLTFAYPKSSGQQQPSGLASGIMSQLYQIFRSNSIGGKPKQKSPVPVQNQSFIYDPIYQIQPAASAVRPTTTQQVQSPQQMFVGYIQPKVYMPSASSYNIYQPGDQNLAALDSQQQIRHLQQMKQHQPNHLEQTQQIPNGYTIATPVRSTPLYPQTIISQQQFTRQNPELSPQNVMMNQRLPVAPVNLQQVRPVTRPPIAGNLNTDTIRVQGQNYMKNPQRGFNMPTTSEVHRQAQQQKYYQNPQIVQQNPSYQGRFQQNVQYTGQQLLFGASDASSTKLSDQMTTSPIHSAKTPNQSPVWHSPDQSHLNQAKQSLGSGTHHNHLSQDSMKNLDNYNQQQRSPIGVTGNRVNGHNPQLVAVDAPGQQPINQMVNKLTVNSNSSSIQTRQQQQVISGPKGASMKGSTISTEQNRRRQQSVSLTNNRHLQSQSGKVNPLDEQTTQTSQMPNPASSLASSSSNLNVMFSNGPFVDLQRVDQPNDRKQTSRRKLTQLAGFSPINITNNSDVSTSDHSGVSDSFKATCPSTCLASTLAFTCSSPNYIDENLACPMSGGVCCVFVAQISSTANISDSAMMLNPSRTDTFTPATGVIIESSGSSVDSNRVDVPTGTPVLIQESDIQVHNSQQSQTAETSNGLNSIDFATRQPTEDSFVALESSRVQTNACGVPGPGRRRTSGHARGRVMGGIDSAPGYWCWQTALVNSKNEYLCGGALIGIRWVLTAAHCVTQHLRSESPLYVRLGQSNLNSTNNDQQAKTIQVKSSYVHHNHNGVTLDNDIALLRLDEAADITEPSICLICLPERSSKIEPGKRCTVTGYGFETESGPAALKIRQTDLPIVADQECQNKTSAVLGKAFTLPASSFCAGGELGQDACHGDGGSPLTCLVDGYYELSGIVSWGYKCGSKDLPGLYSKVSAFVGWINQIISVNN